MPDEFIVIKGARQNNLKGFDLRLPLRELVVVTGVSGSGKSSLAFDTVYAEGQRRYVETFSPYARQFLERMDRPQAERIEGIPPAVAIDQTNPVRTSRSTVGTMTELNDHIKLLYARAARLYCRGCGQEVRQDTPDSIYTALLGRLGTADSAARALITFELSIPQSSSAGEVKALLARQGYTRIQRERGAMLEVIQDRVRIAEDRRDRIVEGLEAALAHGKGRLSVYPLNGVGESQEPLRFSTDRHCPDCDIRYREALPNLFSFNSPIGACTLCRGFGRSMGIDYGLAIPDASKSLAAGAIRPWQTAGYRECQDDLMRFARARGIPTEVAWRELTEGERHWVLTGEGEWEDGEWYGLVRFFRWLETKSYKMHIRVLLSKYRAYNTCTDCQGARLKPEALLWRVGTLAEAERVLAGEHRLRPSSLTMPEARYASLPGLAIHELMRLPIARCHEFFTQLHLPAPMDQATELLLAQIRSRLGYLVEVGLGYLTLDRQSRSLSGGEVQRINLTTALGTSLVNVLFVLDEPSIGLHARDMQRVIGVLHRLRDAGNSLLVVEHDAQVMMAADRVLDLGPGPGAQGGQIVFFGTPDELLRSKPSLTGQYLSGRRRVATGARPSGSSAPAGYLEILGAAAHNLKDLDVRIPLKRLACVTGVSGSGKSTLVEDICYRGVRKLKGQPTEAPGSHREIRGHEQIAGVVLVDQSPIGKTARSNPATYVGALDAIRKLFALEPLARERGYTAGTFSFNTGRGRCPSCGGNGFEHIEMQFLSDVYLRCPECDGSRYRSEVLEVKIRPPSGHAKPEGKSIAEILDLSVTEAIEFFAASPEVLGALEPLQAVGLGYLRLGQPATRLSGGEAQRLKLAGHLAQARDGAGLLFLFDEPTTGLHFEDIATLLQAFRGLLAQGHSLVVIEHNLEVIRAADWVIDLGPEGGEGGGELVCAGTPEQLASCTSSHTGLALRQWQARAVPEPAPLLPEPPLRARAIGIRNAREHNLKGVDIEIPRDRFTVITGISGSGKSTVAFDILFAEGQRRYLESLNAYARQFVQPAARPDVDAVFGIPPTVAIEQRTSRGGRKSTVATLTEIYHFLRLLFVKCGIQYCPDCQIPIQVQSPEAILATILRQYRGQFITVLAPLVVARKGYYTDLANWAKAKGWAQLRVDGELISTHTWPRLDRFKEHDIDLPLGAIRVLPRAEPELRELLARALDLGKGVVKLMLPAALASEEPIFSTQRACAACARGFEELDPRLFSYNSRHGWCECCYGTGLVLAGFDEVQSGEEIDWNEWWEGEERGCSACHGKRLRPEALAVRYHGRGIAELTGWSVAAAERFFRELRLEGREAQIARDIVAELRARLAFLKRVGLSYLTLDRSAPSLSGGEAQRIRLASQLGSNLRGVCYLLDEPTIGLHTRDNHMLIKTLQALTRKGNTVVVVEHDEQTIRAAEHLIDLGPGAGMGGGRVVATGSVAELMRSPESVTGRFLASPLRHPFLESRRLSAAEPGGAIEIAGALLHNLKHLEVAIPLQRLVCITGVSGSGKSTLLRRVLHDNLRRLLAAPGSRVPSVTLQGCRGIQGWQALSRVLEVDQSPIGKTPRSTPATYVGFWDYIRRLFAETPEARMRGYPPGRFSFNVPGGRCEACEGQGSKRIEMSFLPEVRVCCESCAGARFTPETLSVRFKEKSVAEVLAMNVDQAVDFFAAHASLAHALGLLQEVGLGYLRLGQQSPTLSGGEAQRIKLVAELARPRAARRPESASRQGNASHTLYALDEPTIGLHMADVEKLIRVLHRLVAAGNTVVVIEHNLDVVAEADWVIDLGPEGGEGGGRIVAQGPPGEVAGVQTGSYTARALKRFLKGSDGDRAAARAGRGG